MGKVLLIIATGEDRPGLTGKLTELLASYEVPVLDIGQAVIHNWLCVGIMVQLDGNIKNAVIKDLLYTSYELQLRLKFKDVTDDDYEAWVNAQGKPRYIITLLAREIESEHISIVSGVLSEHGMNIDNITRLSGRKHLRGVNLPRRASVEFSVRGYPHDISKLRESFLAIAKDKEVDIAFQEDNVFRRNRRLIAFDMDSTLIQTEVIDELAMEAGVGDQVKAITEQAMRGEFDFKKSLKKRLALLKGLPESVLEQVAARLPLTEGVHRCIFNLKKFGYKVAIISGGFTYFGKVLQKELGIDYVFANELEVKDGQLTGEVIGGVVDSERKAEILKEIAEKENISLQQVIAVGDGANDLPMLNLAGLGIAFHAKPKVKEGAGQSISTIGLDGILYLIGVRDRETMDKFF